MSLDKLNVLANRAFTYINDDQLEKAVDILIAASALAFDSAEAAIDSAEKAELVNIGNDYIGLAEDLLEDIEEGSASTLASKEHTQEEGDKDWRFELPSITFDDVIGMDELKSEITNKLINPTRSQSNNSLANQYKLPKGFGLLLYGPTGTGKTFFAQAVAGELGWPLFVISGSAITSKYVGESEKNLMQLFSQAKSQQRSVIFIDEIETVFPNRKTKDLQQHEKKLAGELLTQLDGIDPVDNWMLIIGATNSPSDLDDALLRDGRLGIHAFVGIPDKHLIVEMLEKDMSDVQITDDISYGKIAEKLRGVTLNSVKRIAEEARGIAYTRDADYYNHHPELEQVARGVSVEDFNQALANCKTMRISEEALAEMRSFQEKHLNHIKASG